MIDNFKNCSSIYMESGRIQCFIKATDSCSSIKVETTRKKGNIYKISLNLQEEPLRTLCLTINQKSLPDNITETIFKYLLCSNTDDFIITVEILTEIINIDEAIAINIILQEEIINELNFYIKIYKEKSTSAVLTLYKLLLDRFPSFWKLLELILILMR